MKSINKFGIGVINTFLKIDLISLSLQEKFKYF